MEFVIGKFARSCIEVHLGVDLAVGVQAALLHYTRRLKSGWEPVGLPQFCRDQPLPDAGAVLELAVSPEIAAVLEHEARRHQVSVDRVLAHAVFVFMADLDSASGSESDARAVLSLMAAG